MSKKFDVIVIGELNVDLILNNIQAFPEVGKEMLAGNMSLTLGSSSAIFASNLAALGVKVSFVGKIGNDVFGQICKSQLHQKGVDTSMLMERSDLQTGATVVLNFEEDRAMVTHQGAMKNLSIADVTPEMLQTARHLHFSSYFLQPGFRNDLHKLFKMAKDHGLTTSLDVQWDPAEQWDFDYKKVLPYVDIFLPNETELLKLTRASAIDDALKVLNGYGNFVLVKQGKRGSILSYKDKTVRGRSFVNEKVVDAIGAGDSFNAGYIFKFIQQYSPEECQVFGNLVGAISTTKSGGTAAFINYDETLKIAKAQFSYDD
jgi:sugar/nucleoside kinase (ribokinase family)